MLDVVGDCWMDRKSAGVGFSVRLLYFPSSAIPTTSTRIPSCFLNMCPIAFPGDPKRWRANSTFTTATRGDISSSCHMNSLPAKSSVPAVRKYSGETLNIVASAAAIASRKSAVMSLKTIASLLPVPSGS